MAEKDFCGIYLFPTSVQAIVCYFADIMGRFLRIKSISLVPNFGNARAHAQVLRGVALFPSFRWRFLAI